MKLSEFFNKIKDKKALIMTIKDYKVDFYVDEIHYKIECSDFAGREDTISIREVGKLTSTPKPMVHIEIGNLDDDRYYVSFESKYEDLFYSLDYERIYMDFMTDLNFRLAYLVEEVKKLDI